MTRVRGVLAVVVVLALWQLVGAAGLVAGGALPAPTAIVTSFVQNAGVYPQHIWATLQAAAAGFVIGNVVAVLLAVLFLLVPAAERISRILLVTLFCLPIVVIAPILGVAFPDEWPKILLAALAVFFPTMIATLVGLQQIPSEAVDVVWVSGGGAIRALLLVRLRGALPDLLAGLQVAAPSAILGAILGEFLGGTRGLGVYLLGTMGSANAAGLWAIGLTAAALSALGYLVFGVLRRLLGTAVAPTVTDVNVGADSAVASRRFRGAARFARAHPVLASIGWTVGGVAFAYLAWRAFIAATGLPTIIMNTPEDVWNSLFVASRSAELRDQLLGALAQSLPPMAVGALAGIAVAFVLALGFSLYPSVARSVMPFAFLSQTMPIVALTPLIALIFGRGDLTIVIVTVSVTFFPSFVAIVQGISRAPQGPVDVLRSVDAGRWRIMFTVILPNALPYLFASVRLAVPRALTGVVLAEQFVTGTGLGGLLGEARGHLDYRAMWVVAVVVAVISVVLYALAHRAERLAEAVLR
ncbi:ABC transporter permease [Herbiconiux sp. YIM B11900]|uniref:ABC transporter permease n=1 Tax=Herbiconiux sp. YIM B11900 TaxID=3404131 RepID=UPI003F84308E